MWSTHERKQQTGGLAPSRHTQPPRTRTAGTQSPAFLPDSTHFLQRYLGNSYAQFMAESGQARSDVPIIQRVCACGGSCTSCAGQENASEKIQPKLIIGQPNDVYEREADRVTEAVMRLPELPTPQDEAISGEVQGLRTQYLSTAGNDEVRRQPLEEKEEEEETLPLQAKECSANSPEITPNLAARIHAIRGRGTPLPLPTRAFFEPRFGSDFSTVRVHTDARAAEAARAVHARAFTVGQDVVFGAGQYALGTTEGRRLLAHELTHVVQQTGAAKGLQPAQVSVHRHLLGRIQRQPLRNTESVEEPRAPGKGPLSAYGLSQLRRDYPEFAGQIEEFSQRFWDLYELTQGPLILSGILDAPYYIQARKQFNDYLDRLRSRERYMEQNDQYSPRDIRNWLDEASMVLSAVPTLMDLAEPGVSDDAQETEAIRQIRGQLPKLTAELTKLQNVPIIRAETEEIEAAAKARRVAAEEKAANAETPEGRREDAVAFTRAFVMNEHQWWPGQALSTAEVFAEQLGGYYLREKKLTGADIQMVLATLGDEDPDMLDRALYQGELLGYLHDQGVTGLNFSELPHATGSGFYNGFEFTWRDLIAAQPITIPSFSPPTPLDVMQYQWGLQWGVLLGIKDGVVNTAQDVFSLFQVETYQQLYDMLTSQIWDETWREDMGKSFAIALHTYLQDVGNDGPFEIGKRFGRFIGQAVFEIILGILTAGVFKVVTKALRGTKWGAALLDFADDVAHAMPWREPKIVEGEAVADTSPRSVETSPLKTEITPSAPRKSAGEGTVSPADELPQVSAGTETDVPSRGEPEGKTALASPPTKAGGEPPRNLPTLSPTEEALLKRTGDRKAYPGALPTDMADQELAIVRRAEKTEIKDARDEYIYEVDLGNGHKWKGKQDGTWCRFSPTPPTNCNKPGAVDKPSGAESTDPALEAARVESELPKEVKQLVDQGMRLEPEEFTQFRELVSEHIPEMEVQVKSAQAAYESAKQAYQRALSDIGESISELDVHINSILAHRKEFPEQNQSTQGLLNELRTEKERLSRKIVEKKSDRDVRSANVDSLRSKALELYEKRFTLQQTNYLRNQNSINKERTRLQSTVTTNQTRIKQIDRLIKANEVQFEKDLNQGVPQDTAIAKLKESNKGLGPEKIRLVAENRNIERNLIRELEERESKLSQDFLETRTIMEAEELAGRFDKEIYLRLRRRTPNDDIRRRVIMKANNKDAIYGTDIEGTPEADHIVPMYHIVEMEGFRDLKDDYKVKVLNYRENFWALDKRVNGSKGGRLFDEWSGHPDFPPLTPRKLAELRDLETGKIDELKREIEKYLNLQKAELPAR